MSRRRPPDGKIIVFYLLIGLALMALVGLALGGAGGFRLVRLLVIYAAVFLLVLYVFRASMRNRH